MGGLHAGHATQTQARETLLGYRAGAGCRDSLLMGGLRLQGHATETQAHETLLGCRAGGWLQRLAADVQSACTGKGVWHGVVDIYPAAA